jgi:hypothetical protein
MSVRRHLKAEFEHVPSGNAVLMITNQMHAGRSAKILVNSQKEVTIAMSLRVLLSVNFRQSSVPNLALNSDG